MLMEIKYLLLQKNVLQETNYSSLSKNVIKEALQFSNLRMDDIDAFAIGWNPSINLENFKNSFSYTSLVSGAIVHRSK